MTATKRIGELTIAVDSAAPRPHSRVASPASWRTRSALVTGCRAWARHGCGSTCQRRSNRVSARDSPRARALAIDAARARCPAKRSALARERARADAKPLRRRAPRRTRHRHHDFRRYDGRRSRSRTPIDASAPSTFSSRNSRTALRERRADYAVHSCKDLASELAGDMRIAAISLREDPRDAFCSERFRSSKRCRRAPSSERRARGARRSSHALRPDLRYEAIRGNVDTRLRKLREGEYDAIVLAMAGLNRLAACARRTSYRFRSTPSFRRPLKERSPSRRAATTRTSPPYCTRPSTIARSGTLRALRTRRLARAARRL